MSNIIINEGNDKQAIFKHIKRIFNGLRSDTMKIMELTNLFHEIAKRNNSVDILAFFGINKGKARGIKSSTVLYKKDGGIIFNLVTDYKSEATLTKKILNNLPVGSTCLNLFNGKEYFVVANQMKVIYSSVNDWSKGE